MAITPVVAWTGATNSGSGPVVLSAVNASGANFIALTIAASAGGIVIADTSAATWQLAIGPISSSTDNVYIYYAENVTGNAAHAITVTANGGAAFCSCAAEAYGGMPTSGTLDKTQSNSGSGTALDSGNTATTTQADELQIGAGTVSSGSNSTFSAGTNFTMRSQFGNASASSIIYCEERIVSATGAYSAPATWNGTGGSWVALIATFKGTGGGPVTVGLTGSAVAYSAGTLAPSSTVPLSGSAETYSAGTIAPTLSVPLAGSLESYSAGTLTPSTTVPLAGSLIVYSAGTLTPSGGTGGDVTVALTGSAYAYSAGTLGVASTVPIAGALATFSTGTIAASLDLALTGSSITYATGIFGKSSTAQLTGSLIVFSRGFLTPSGGNPPVGGTQPYQQMLGLSLIRLGGKM